MQEEIFGPVLPVKTYKDVSEPVNYINSKDRPLGFIILEKIMLKKNLFLEIQLLVVLQ